METKLPKVEVWNGDLSRLTRGLIPDFEVPTPKPRSLTPHCYECKVKLPDHSITCKHYHNGN